MWKSTVHAKGAGYSRLARRTLIWIVAAYVASAQQKKAITPADCVTVGYLRQGNANEPPPITISADGRRTAYLVKEPDLATNQNRISLFVRQIASDASLQVRPILKGESPAFAGSRIAVI